ncbi:BREX-1 system adenine-specific DNA-methyltransferase PglX [Pseudomonas soli]|uniref:BREX-1 system adenine-specific DNA-methyltransferase PglX n=1 Tax=Pseudomonas soli TaxID=1306993 RepID=UPI002893C335|nr:BREX-1 system adenine-specific DNA-methyltransferase PglX [Pseudomonas soli]MDT3714381.1 BREX-1 system adenine-specific DNA-methyltransferase PglX [Pseudomonas soli]MDT3731099.1 BREX-1 system adenine-specific DNA-methyltransferase PglX [Pseudomonas soli]
MNDSQASKADQSVEKFFFRASAADFKKIPGSPIGYWVSGRQFDCFEKYPQLSDFAVSSNGVQTGNNAKYVRLWSEVSASKINSRWFPYNKGGQFRRWYGNFDFLVNWESDGAAIKSEKNFCARGEEFYFSQGITWSDITSGKLSGRILPEGFLFDASGPSAFFKDPSLTYVGLALLNTKFADSWSKILNPTLHFQSGDFRKLTLAPDYISESTRLAAKSLLEISKDDWDAYETSWDFTSLPLLHADHRQTALKASYQKLHAHWREITQEMQRLEEENNHIFIDAYGLQDELTPEVPLSEITLTCNPYYRYGGDKSEEELEAMLLADTMRELVSYAVGCMFGRYSLDKPGLILANQGETLADYLGQVPQPSFPADDDNVIPLLDGDWFPDDITLRFRQFLRVAFGDAHYEDNLAFIEQALNVKGKRNYSLRDYFLSEFYTDHVKRYKKRPIYWLFSSPKGTFNALVYLHRYRSDTVSMVLNYLRDFRKKLASRLDYLQQVAINSSASQSEKTKASKEADTIKKQLIELDDYERETLYPLATEQVELELDDGVKVNYLKLGAALKKIPGLEAKED